MQSVYAIDLRTALWGEQPIGLRRLCALVAGIPPGGALDRAIDPEGWGSNWHHTEELLAIIAELLDRDWRQTVQSNRKRGAVKPKPLRIPRPRDILRRAQRITNPTGEQLRAFLEAKGVVGRRRGGDS